MKGRYKGIQVGAFGLPVFNPKKKSVPNNKPVKDKRNYLASFLNSFPKNSPKDSIVMYDIPEESKKNRDWFRRQLKAFDYIMIQRSVWVGPSPLPKEFIAYLKSLGLNSKFRILKLAKPYKDSTGLIL